MADIVYILKINIKKINFYSRKIFKSLRVVELYSGTKALISVI